MAVVCSREKLGKRDFLRLSPPRAKATQPSLSLFSHWPLDPICHIPLPSLCHWRRQRTPSRRSRAPWRAACRRFSTPSAKRRRPRWPRRRPWPCPPRTSPGPPSPLSVWARPEHGDADETTPSPTSPAEAGAVPGLSITSRARPPLGLATLGPAVLVQCRWPPPPVRTRQIRPSQSAGLTFPVYKMRTRARPQHPAPISPAHAQVHTP